MKSYVYLIILLSMLVNIAIFTGLPFRFISVSSINFKELNNIKDELNNKFASIINETNSDVVWISLFHSISGRALRETEIFVLPSLRFDPLYESTLHYLTTKESVVKYRPKFNEPILGINRIAETLAGSCVNQIMPVNSEITDGISLKNFIIRCPLIFEDKVVGSYGVIIYDMDLIDLTAKSETLTSILKSYNTQIVNILFN